MSFPSSFKFERPLIVGHRGYKARYPENTLIAFKAAMDAGVRMVELDVHLTRDRELVVIHDDTLDRTTNGTGPVDGRSLAELRKLEAGSWFHPRFDGERIPTLKEVLDLLERRVLINVEIKSAGESGSRESSGIETVVLDLLEREKALSTVLVSSFDPKIVETVHRINAEIPVALISASARGMETVRLCRELGVFSFHPNFRCLTPDLMAGLHDAGIHVFPYTVNTEPDFKRMIQIGVDGVITDDPVQVKKWHARLIAQSSE